MNPRDSSHSSDGDKFAAHSTEADPRFRIKKSISGDDDFSKRASRFSVFSMGKAQTDLMKAASQYSWSSTFWRSDDFWLARSFRSQAMKAFYCALIVLDFALQGYMVQVQVVENGCPDWMYYVQIGFLAIFIVFTCIDFMVGTESNKEERQRIFSWKLVDHLFVLGSLVLFFVLGMTSSVTVLVRMLRICRVFTEGKYFPCMQPLRVFIACAKHAFGFLVTGLLLYLIHLVISATFIVQILIDQIEEQEDEIAVRHSMAAVQECKAAFSTPLNTMATLFTISVGGDRWQQIVYPITQDLPWAFVFFAGHNLITIVIGCGTLYMAALEAQRLMREDCGQMWYQEKRKEKTRAHERFRRIFRKLNSANDGLLTWKEFLYNSKNNEPFEIILDTLDVAGEAELHQLWKLFDRNDSGTATEDQFVQVIYRLMNDTKATLIRLSESHHMQTKDLITSLQKSLQHMEGDNQRGVSELKHELSRALGGLESDGLPLQSSASMTSLAGAAAGALVSLDSFASDEQMVGKTYSQASAASQNKRGSRLSAQPSIPEDETEETLQAKVERYMRGCPAGNVARYGDSQVIDFWTNNGSIPNLPGGWYGLSISATYCDFFVSHCWQSPPDWNDFFNQNDQVENYGYIKAMELYHILKSAQAAGIISEGQSSLSKMPTIKRNRRSQFFIQDKMPSDKKSLVRKTITNLLSTTPKSMNKRASLESGNSSGSAAARLKRMLSGKNLDKPVPAFEKPAEVPRSTKKNDLDGLKRIILWVDKCCIPQDDMDVRTQCVLLIEEFLANCNGLVVLLSWNYFSRLWCLYEWACFLRLHHPLRVQICCDSFLKSSPDETLPLYIQSIRNLSVKNAECFNRSDIQILEDKVFKYYKGNTKEESFASFERFAQCAAIALISKEIVSWRARISLAEERAWLGPLIELAAGLHYSDLCRLLRSAQPATWFANCNQDQESFKQIVDCWFEDMVVKYLLCERKLTVRKRRSLIGKGDQKWSKGKSNLPDARLSGRQNPGRQSTVEKVKSWESFGDFSTGMQAGKENGDNETHQLTPSEDSSDGNDERAQSKDSFDNDDPHSKNANNPSSQRFSIESGSALPRPDNMRRLDMHDQTPETSSNTYHPPLTAKRRSFVETI